MPKNKINMKPWLWDLAYNIVKIYDMDASHDLTHFSNTVKYLRLILPEFADVPIIDSLTKQEETEILTEAAFVHDLVDHKYTAADTRQKLLESAYAANGEPPWRFDIINTIISNMYFSVRTARQKQGLSPIAPGPCALAIAIVADADQLDAYRPERVVIYQNTKYDMSDPELAEINLRMRKTIFVNRILKYRDHYMTTETAKKLAIPLHDELEQYVRSELYNIDVYDTYP